MHFDILDGDIVVFEIFSFYVFHQSPNEHDVIYADIEDLSQSPQEQEILFPLEQYFVLNRLNLMLNNNYIKFVFY
jgi:hypothetical protein